MPTAVFGGVSLLTMLINDPAYQANALRQDLWRAGHAHAGVLLVLSLVALRYVDETSLGDRARWFARLAIPAAAILLPADARGSRAISRPQRRCSGLAGAMIVANGPLITELGPPST